MTTLTLDSIARRILDANNDRVDGIITRAQHGAILGRAVADLERIGLTWDDAAAHIEKGLGK